MNVADFDAWRERYDDMTYREMADFYDAVEVDHPLQKAFNTHAFSRFFDHVIAAIGSVCVVEFGGWKGELARLMLEKPGIAHWTNVEICRRAIEKSTFTSPRYWPVERKCFIGSPGNDKVFVASHFIEHVREIDLDSIFERLTKLVCFAGIQAPIPKSGFNVDWTGYHGTHVLEIGWEQVGALLLGYGFAEIPSLRVDDFRAFYREPEW